MGLKTLTNLVAVGAVTLAGFMPLSNTATAGEYRGKGGQSYSGRYDGAPRVNRWGDVKRHDWNGGRNYAQGGYGNYGGHRRHRDHTGRAIAIGTFAAILGLALASQSRRVQEEYYDDRD